MNRTNIQNREKPIFGDIIEKYEITNNKGREHPNIQWGEMEENPADLNRQRWNDIKENKRDKPHTEPQEAVAVISLNKKG